ncbi:MAG: response regulator [Bacteroidota bacterium]|nr:response regulator [Bacteroidota bacterium]
MNDTILIVDDEESLRLTLRLRLAAQGFNIILAEDGDVALEQLKKSKVDLVLLDINMPKMDGIEALGHITEMYPNVEVVMLTGFADFTTAIECLKKGAKDYLVKPIEVTELITRVRSILRARSSEQALHDLRLKFMSTFLHDMLNPLKTVGSTIEQVRDGAAGKLTKDQNVLLSYVSDLSERLVKRIKNLIDLSLFEEGKIVLDRHPLDIEMFINTICLRYEIMVKSKKITFQKQIEKKLPQISCDFDRIDTVLNSLLDNAIKYSDEGGSIIISASMTTYQHAGKNVDGILISVKDTGKGMSADEIKNLFTIYKTQFLKPITDSSVPSFSLAIVKHIIDAHNGSITVQSDPGKGSLFTFTLPLQ